VAKDPWHGRDGLFSVPPPGDKEGEDEVVRVKIHLPYKIPECRAISQTAGPFDGMAHG
jgi:hypothetical protein